MVDDAGDSPNIPSREYQLLDNQYVRSLNDVTIQEAEFLQSLINLPGEQILYVGQTALSYSDSEVTNTCFSDALASNQSRNTFSLEIVCRTLHLPPVSIPRGLYGLEPLPRVVSLTSAFQSKYDQNQP